MSIQDETLIKLPEPLASSRTKLVKVRVATAYGQRRYEPINDCGRAFLLLTRGKTFTKDDVELIKLLGFKVVIEAQVL